MCAAKGRKPTEGEGRRFAAVGRRRLFIAPRTSKPARTSPCVQGIERHTLSIDIGLPLPSTSDDLRPLRGTEPKTQKQKQKQKQQELRARAPLSHSL